MLISGIIECKKKERKKKKESMLILLFVKVVRMVHTCGEAERRAVNRRTKHINQT